MESFFKSIDPMLVLLFKLHDLLSDFITKNIIRLKLALVLIAHLALFGFFLPEFRKDFGSIAEYLLIGLLFLSPLSKIFRMRLLLLLMSMRRQMGILMAYLATVHGIGFLTDPFWANFYVKPYIGSNFFEMDTRYIFGIFAYFLTLPLLLTSNDFANRGLGKNWKRLHRIVYVMALLVVLHVMLLDERGQGVSIFNIAQAVFLIASYILVKLLAWKNFLPPLVRAIEIVAARYKVFRTPAPLLPTPTIENIV